jgi:hypothetical protein
MLDGMVWRYRRFKVALKILQMDWQRRRKLSGDKSALILLLVPTLFIEAGFYFNVKNHILRLLLALAISVPVGLWLSLWTLKAED